MRRGKKIKIPIIACLLLLTATILAAVAISQTGNPQQPLLLAPSLQQQPTPQPPPKQYTPVTWTNPTISNLNVSEDLNITLNGNLNITETGELHLIHCILNVNNGTSPIQYGVTVYGGMYINQSSTITALNSTNPYYFTVYEGAAFQMNGSRVEYCGHSTGSWPDQQGLMVRVDNAWIENNTLINSCNGILLWDSQGSTILNNNITGIYYTGMGIRVYNCLYNNIEGNTAINNYMGFLLEDSSYNNLTSNTAKGNQVEGFKLTSSSYNNLSDNTATNNGGLFGSFRLESSSNNNILSGNTANNNYFYGFRLEFSSNNNNLTGNTANNNRLYGFYLYYNSNNILSGNTANNNGQYGFALYYSSNNNFSGNTAINNRNIGFRLASSSNNNNLTGNIAMSNTNGFWLDSSLNNNLTGNTVINSTIGYYWTSDSIDNDFTGSTWFNYLRVNVTDALGFPIEGAEVGVVTPGSTLIYSSGWTNCLGVTQWFVVPYGTFTGPTTMTNEYTTVFVGYQGFSIENNYRPVVMSNSHVETFRVIDNSDPVVAIMFPASNSTVNTSVIWIMGNFDGTGSQLTNITINDSRYTLLEPLGPPFGLTGTFRFIASGIGTSEFDIEVTVQDGTGRVATATRHIVVVVQQPSSPSEGFSVPLAMLSALMLSSAQGGVSPMIYTAVGTVAGVGVAAAVLFYYFRIRRV